MTVLTTPAGPHDLPLHHEEPYDQPQPGGERSPASGQGAAERSRLADVLVVAATLALLATVLFWGGWTLAGGHLRFMTTPSMSPNIPVGSMLADRPAHGTLHVGQVITFRPPMTHNETFSHRITAVGPGPVYHTKGDLNASDDPWLITPSDIAGVTVFSVGDLGWLLKVLPFVAVGIIALQLLRSRRQGPNRRTVTRLWVTALAVIPLLVLHPLVRATMYSTIPTDGLQVRGQVVNTGILPVAMSMVHGQHAGHVAPGRAVSLVGTPQRNGSLLVKVTASLHWWGWAILTLLVLSPLLDYLWRDGRHPDRRRARSTL